MKVYLDDVRPAPEGWVLVKTAREVLDLLALGKVEELSLDHDLGEIVAETLAGLVTAWRENPQDGTWLVYQMIERDLWPVHRPRVHSANPVGAERMRGLISRYGPYGGQER